MTARPCISEEETRRRLLPSRCSRVSALPGVVLRHDIATYSLTWHIFTSHRHLYVLRESWWDDEGFDAHHRQYFGTRCCAQGKGAYDGQRAQLPGCAAVRCLPRVHSGREGQSHRSGSRPRELQRGAHPPRVVPRLPVPGLLALPGVQLRPHAGRDSGHLGDRPTALRLPRGRHHGVVPGGWLVRLLPVLLVAAPAPVACDTSRPTGHNVPFAGEVKSELHR